MDCVFCKIVAGEIPSRKVYEDDRTLAFYDLDPKAPVHVLVIPKRHLGSILDPASPEEAEALFRAVQKVAALLEDVYKRQYRPHADELSAGGVHYAEFGFLFY